MRRTVAISVLLLWLMSPVVAVAPPPADSTGAPVAQLFMSRPDEAPTRYLALRRIEAANPRFKLHGWIEASTELTADGRFHYRILRQGGSDYIVNKVLRPVLENEQKLFATGDSSRSAVTAENYTLKGAEAAEPGLVKLLVAPKRRDVSLIEGALFVTEEDADLVRVEGRLAKNPSFWTKRVDVVRHYSRIGGTRVPTRLDSVAQIRFAGSATLSMTWEYETINGQAPASASAGERPGPAGTASVLP
jgi:hypothetical protein